MLHSESVSSVRIWSVVTSEGMGSRRTKCSRGFFLTWFSSNAEMHAQQKMCYFCYFGFVLMAQTMWKQSAREVLSSLSRLLLHSFEIQHIKQQEWKERKEGPCLFWMALCLMVKHGAFGRLLDIHEMRKVAVTVRDSVIITARCLHFS